MKNKSLKLLFCLTLLSVLFMILGCGSGGSQSVLQQESPEAAVMRISNDWRASTESPAVIVDASNRFIRQATVQETETNSSSNLSGKVIYLQDLISSETYKLEVVDVERVNDRAAVTCNFYYENGTLNIVFKLEFEEGKWWLDDVEITDKAFEKGEAAYLVEHYLYSGDHLDKIVRDDLIVDKIDAKVEAISRNDFDNYLFISTDTRNIATGTVLASDDSAYPLTLKLYYKKLADYTVTCYFLDESNNIVSEKTESIAGKGFIGDTIKIEEKDYKTFDGYELIAEIISETIKNITEITLKDGEANELKFYYKLEKGDEPEKGDKITGTITDEGGHAIAASIQLFKVNDEGKAVPVEKNGESWIIRTEDGKYTFEDLEQGTYLLVVSANGYEPKTIKVSLPEDSNNNVRANIQL